MSKIILTEWCSGGRLQVFSSIINRYYLSKHAAIARYILPVFGLRSFVKALLSDRTRNQNILLPNAASGFIILIVSFAYAFFKYIYILIKPNWIKSLRLYGLFCGHDVASTICRIKRSSNPYPAKDFFLIYVLYRIYSNIFYFSLVTHGKELFFFPSHDIYWSRIRNRVCSSRSNVKLIYCNSSLNPYEISYKPGSITSYSECYPSSLDGIYISQEQRFKSQKSLEDRLSGKTKIPYLIQSPYLKTKLDVVSNSAAVDEQNSPTFVIFLHSFNDALFPYGPNGFVNPYQWAKFIVKSLSSLYPAADYGLIIKPHPVFYNSTAFDSNSAERDKNIFESFMSDVSRSFPHSPITIWDKSIPELIRTYPKLIGLTLHGSVLVELLYQQVPVIFSSTHPYAPYINTPLSWSTPSDLYQLLSTPSEVSEFTSPSKQLLDAYSILELNNPFRSKPDIVSYLSLLIYDEQLTRAEQSKRADEIISKFNSSSFLQRSLNNYVNEVLAHVL